MAKQTAEKPGAVLKESFLSPYGISPAKLAEDTGINLSTIRQILIGKTRISLNVAFRLSRYFGNDFQYWLDLQTLFEVTNLQNDHAYQEALKKIHRVKKQDPGKKASLKKTTEQKPTTKKKESYS
jgi:addiction module HigA family antidote